MIDGIIVAPIESALELEGHTCGNVSIDHLVESSYCAHVCNQITTYKVIYADEVVGFYSIYVTSINVDNDRSEEDVSQYFDKTPSFGVIYIKFIAVDLDIQNHGIGKVILSVIVKNARDLHAKLPIRMIVFDALKDKISFYENRGFKLLYKDEVNSQQETVKMYLDLATLEELNAIDAYHRSII